MTVRAGREESSAATVRAGRKGHQVPFRRAEREPRVSSSVRAVPRSRPPEPKGPPPKASPGSRSTVSTNVKLQGHRLHLQHHPEFLNQKGRLQRHYQGPELQLPAEKLQGRVPKCPAYEGSSCEGSSIGISISNCLSDFRICGCKCKPWHNSAYVALTADPGPRTFAIILEISGVRAERLGNLDQPTPLGLGPSVILKCMI